MRVQKFFGNNKDTGSFFTVADLFGYVIAFFLLWLIILGYKAISRASSHVPDVKKIKSEIVEKSTPIVLEASQATSKKIEDGKEEVKTTSKVVAESAIELITDTREKASKILSKEGAEETILTVNSYIDSLISTVAEVKEQKDRPNPKPNKKDSLSSF